MGHLIYSIYDYAVTQAFGFPVDYSKSLHQSHKELLDPKKITPQKLDSLTEKIEGSLSDMHRPIVASESAHKATLYAADKPDKTIALGRELNEYSWDYLSHSEIDPQPSDVIGVVSSYNISTYKGRLYIFEEQRPISFELTHSARDKGSLGLITSSLRTNAVERGSRDGSIVLTGKKIRSSTGRLKGISVLRVTQQLHFSS